MLAAGFLTARAEAQGDCFPPDDSHEARAMAIALVPVAYGPAGAPRMPEPGQVAVGLEGAWLPNIDSATSTPTVCRPGKGPENTNVLFGILRPRVDVGLPWGLLVSGSWVPPVRVHGVRAHLGALALSRVTRLGERADLAVRGHIAFGEIRAPITCDEDALEDPASECFGGTLSDDELHPNVMGIDVSVGWEMARGRFVPYLGAGYSRLAPRFRVDFTNSAGQRDRRRVEVDLNRAVLFGGASWIPGRRVSLSGEFYAAPADAATVRVLFRYVPWG